MSNRRRIPRTIGAALVVGFSVVLVGCSSSASPSSSSSPVADSIPPSGTSVIAPGGTVPFNLAHNARADVDVASCAEVSGEWVLKGSVKNFVKGL